MFVQLSAVFSRKGDIERLRDLWKRTVTHERYSENEPNDLLASTTAGSSARAGERDGAKPSCPSGRSS